jgi:hypothetical protein
MGKIYYVSEICFLHLVCAGNLGAYACYAHIVNTEYRYREKGNAVDFLKSKASLCQLSLKIKSQKKKNAVNHVRVESGGGVW